MSVEVKKDLHALVAYANVVTTVAEKRFLQRNCTDVDKGRLRNIE